MRFNTPFLSRILRWKRASQLECESAFHASSSVRYSFHDDGLILLDTSGGTVYSANAIGAKIWKDVLAGMCVQEIAEDLSLAHSIPRLQAERDAKQYVGDLQTAGLLRPGRMVA